MNPILPEVKVDLHAPIEVEKTFLADRKTAHHATTGYRLEAAAGFFHNPPTSGPARDRGGRNLQPDTFRRTMLPTLAATGQWRKGTRGKPAEL